MWRGICQLKPVKRRVCFFSSQQETEVGGLSVSATKTKIKCTGLKKAVVLHEREA